MQAWCNLETSSDSPVVRVKLVVASVDCELALDALGIDCKAKLKKWQREAINLMTIVQPIVQTIVLT